MDIDHLLKLVLAARDEAEATNDSGPAYDALLAYIDKERGPSIRQALRDWQHRK